MVVYTVKLESPINYFTFMKNIDTAIQFDIILNKILQPS
jgi:hypothetical protein